MPHDLTLATVVAVDVFPDFGALDGADGLRAAIGSLLAVVLVVSVLMLIVCGVTWAVANAHGNYEAAGKARRGVWVAVGAAALAGAGVAWVRFLIGLGTTLS